MEGTPKSFAGFDLKRYEIDSGLIGFSSNSEHAEAESFYNYMLAVDRETGLKVEVLSVGPNSEQILSKSAKKKSNVSWVGTYPKFLKLDKHGNLVAIVPEGCVLRIDFFGDIKYRKPRVKYYKTI